MYRTNQQTALGRRCRQAIGLATLVMCAAQAGCTSLNFTGCEIPAIPAGRVPREVLGRARDDMQQITISRLRQNPPPVYQLGSGDVLGIYIEFVLGEEGESPPVHFPEQGDQPPALGYPVPVREDGTLSLPLIPPVPVAGLTVEQATERIRTTYLNAQVLQAGRDKVIVTLMRRREYRILVVREEEGGTDGVTKHGTGTIVDLPAYENDLLHALNETGGLPGLDAKNEVLIMRGGFNDGAQRDLMVAHIMSSRQPCECPPVVPDDPNTVRIPIRFHPEDVPLFEEKDIILKTGDVVYIPSRETERFYTGGVMAGGEHMLPRDYDLDVLGAIAVAGGPVGSGGTGIGQAGGRGGMGGGRGSAIGKNPSRLLVIRKLECGGTLAIRVDTNRALTDSSQRILVQPEDTLILQYTITEELYNAALNLIQFQFLFNGLTGKGI
ncbi:MAG: polysaccharide biosynthesis/export family protein [Planctomycetaceae bacterium]|nr:polysaccharide biosynthesis/export family protein [Planctomycetaceae bacterium]